MEKEEEEELRRRMIVGKQEQPAMVDITEFLSIYLI